MNEIIGGTLYLVPTPIGNLSDMTERAVSILREADIIAAEDTRHTKILMEHFDIHRPLVPYHEHNKEEAGPRLIEALEAGKSVAQVSDAGMPVISDPGADLVRLALEKGIRVVPLPGPNAALTALIASGLDARQFTFIGFLPKTKTRQKKLLDAVLPLPMTLIFYEAPHRLKETLKLLIAALGPRRAVLARELTKKFETFERADLQTLLDGLDDQPARGEYVILTEGSSGETVPAEQMLQTEDWPSLVAALMEQGMTEKEACRQVARQAGVSRRDVYQLIQKIKNNHSEE